MQTHTVTGRWWRAVAAAVLAAGAVAAPLALPPTAAADGPDCTQVAVPVAPAAGQPASLTLRGTLCRPGGWTASGGDVDVLLAGATYDRRYWDWPVDPGTYSVVARSLAAGRATLAADRIGTGASSHPAGTSLTMAGDAFTVHQVVQWLRADPQVHRVTLIGHSLGSGVAAVEAATYRDVDRLVLTGMLHSVGSGLAGVFASFQPVTVSTVLAALPGTPLAGLPGLLVGQLLDVGQAGYLTTAAGTRRASFYAPSADPAVVDYDEVHKDAVATGELAGYGGVLAPPDLNTTRLVDVPVLLVAGQLDVLLCGGTLDCTDAAAVRANELPYFPAAPAVDVLTVPATGHDLALHPSSGATSAAIDAWIAAH